MNEHDWIKKEKGNKKLMTVCRKCGIIKMSNWDDHPCVDDYEPTDAVLRLIELSKNSGENIIANIEGEWVAIIYSTPIYVMFIKDYIKYQC